MDLLKREQLFKMGYYNLDRNENLDKIYLEQLDDIFKKYSSQVSVYPDYPKFTLRLSSFFGVSPQEILPVCGCTEAIKIAADCFIDTGADVLVLAPTYESAITYFRLLDAHIHYLPYWSDVDKIKFYISKNNIKFVYLCNPNNPTGTYYTCEQLRELSSCETVIFIDESYFEFCDSTAIPLIKSTDNFIIGRSFSKAWGLAGLRTGVLISNKEMLEELSTYKLKASTNSLAVKVVSELMDNYKMISNSVSRIKVGNDYMRRLFKSKGYTVYNEPNVNFLTCDIPSADLDAIRVLHKVVDGKQCITVVPADQAEKIFKFQ